MTVSGLAFSWLSKVAILALLEASSFSVCDLIMFSFSDRDCYLLLWTKVIPLTVENRRGVNPLSYELCVPLLPKL